MSKDSGLLSRVVKFVRNPRTEWSDLDSVDAPRSEQEDEASKQQLREMLERKRQNDFVRKREFDALRKLRNKEVDAPVAMHSPSFFPSSEPSEPLGGKSKTLEKIAAIEEQMSNQWFKGRSARQDGLLEASAARSALPTQSVAMNSGGGGVSDSAVDPAAFAPTQTLDMPGSASVHADLGNATAEARQPALDEASSSAATTPVDVAPLIGSDQLVPSLGHDTQMEVAELVNDAELDEIAILYANGETSAAEEGLLRLIGRSGSRREQPELWMALFDLYRATGQHSRFDEVGIEFASVFGRSAPGWYSLPEQLQQQGGVEEDEPAPVSTTSNWTANSTLSAQNLAMLDTLAQRGIPLPWRLDWRYVKRVENGCGGKLAQRLNAWSNDPQMKLRFVGAEVLLKLLDELAPVGDASAPQDLWSLRLAMLRILGRMDDFELHALNFCVTYEVSPPSWEPVRAECLEIQADGALAVGVDDVAGDVAAVVANPVFAETDVESWRADPNTTVADDLSKAELMGEVLGDSPSKFATLNEVAEDAAVIEVDCRRVQRVDFVAAGTLLNWVSDHQSKGQSIAFNNVNRLVAIFFRIIGIRELATVNVRKE